MGTQHDRDGLAPDPLAGLTLAAFAKLIERNTKINLRVGMPAEVVAWRGPVAAGVKSKPALVDVQPHFIFTVTINVPEELTAAEKAEGWVLGNENGGYVKRFRLPVIRNCPVHYPGQSGMMIRGKLRVGEVGWIKIADRSLDKWTQTGGPVDPGFSQFHDLTDAVFEPGLRYGQIAKSIDEDKLTIGPEDNSAGLDIDDVVAPALPDIALRTSGETATVEAAVNVLLGINAMLGVSRLTDTTAADASMSTWITQVTVALGQIAVLLNAPGPVIGAPGTVTPVTGTPSDFGVIDSASTKVKAE